MGVLEKREEGEIMERISYIVVGCAWWKMVGKISFYSYRISYRVMWYMA